MVRQGTPNPALHGVSSKDGFTATVLSNLATVLPSFCYNQATFGLLATVLVCPFGEDVTLEARGGADLASSPDQS